MARTTKSLFTRYSKAIEVLGAILRAVFSLKAAPDVFVRLLKDKERIKQIAELIVRPEKWVLMDAVDLFDMGLFTDWDKIPLEGRLETLLALAKFDRVGEGVRSSSCFVLEEDNPRIGKEHLHIALFYLPKRTTTKVVGVVTAEEVLVQMDRRNFRPATCTELLLFAKDNPNLQWQFPVFALGARDTRFGGYLCISHEGACRTIEINPYTSWGSGCQFLAVKKDKFKKKK